MKIAFEIEDIDERDFIESILEMSPKPAMSELTDREWVKESIDRMLSNYVIAGAARVHAKTFAPKAKIVKPSALMVEAKDSLAEKIKK